MPGLCKGIEKKLWNMKMTFIPIISSAFDRVKGTGGIGNKRMSGDHPNYYITEFAQNTEKGPGDLWRLAVTLASVKDHQQTLT